MTQKTYPLTPSHAEPYYVQVTKDEYDHLMRATAMLNELLQGNSKQLLTLVDTPRGLGILEAVVERIGKNETPAGSKLGKRSTPFTRTVDALMQISGQ